MLILCNNKGCMLSSNALFNTETKEVICQECGSPISNISDAMKRALKNFGQIVRASEKKAFMVNCHNCNANRELVLDQDNKTICKICHKQIVIHAAFRTAMEEAGHKLEKINTEQNTTEKE